MLAGQLAGHLQRADHLGADPGPVGAGELGPGPGGQDLAVPHGEDPLDAGVDGLGPHRDRPRLGVPGGARPQIAGQDGPEEGHGDQSARELLGDERDLHAGRPVGAQRPPAGRGHRLLQPRDTVRVGQVADGAGPEITGQPRGRVA